MRRLMVAIILAAGLLLPVAGDTVAQGNREFGAGVSQTAQASTVVSPPGGPQNRGTAVSWVATGCNPGLPPNPVFPVDPLCPDDPFTD